LETYVLTITIVFIILSTFVAAFIRGRKRDKCLKDFAGFFVTLEDASGKAIWGALRVENTGLELVYSSTHEDADGHVESSFILYKYEYANMRAMIRFHDELSEKGAKKRQKDLDKTYHPGPMRRLKRKTLNVFKTIRDSVMEVVNLLISRAQKATPAGNVLTSQDKYVSQIKQELMGSVGTSYEPLLERYIGHMVVLELIRGEKVLEYSGVLKDYTADFIELMDVEYAIGDSTPPRKADIVVPRKCGIIRHLGE
jgi:hypothetical protein